MAMTAFPAPPNGSVMDRSGSLSLSGAVVMADGGEVNPTRIGRSRSSVRLIGPEITGPDSGEGGQTNNIAQPKERVRRHSSINYQAQRAQQVGIAAPIEQNPSMRVMPSAPPQQQQQKQFMMRPGSGTAPPAAMAAPAPTGAVMPQHQHRQQLPPAMQPQPLQTTVEEEQQPPDSPPKQVFLSGPPPGGAAPRRIASQRRLSETTASMSATFPRPCPPSRSRSGKPSTREAEPQSVRKSSPRKSSSGGGATESPDLKPRSRVASPTVESDLTAAPKAKRTASFFRPETPPRRRRAAAKVDEEKNENSGAMQKLSSFFFGKPRSATREQPASYGRPTSRSRRPASRSERPASRSRRRSNDSCVKVLSGIEEVQHQEGRLDEVEVEELEEVLYQRELKRMDSVFRTKSFRGNFSDNDDDDDDDDGDNSEGRRSAPAQAEDSPRSSSPLSNSESPAYAGSVFAEDTPRSSEELRNSRSGDAARARSASADPRNSSRCSNSSSTSSDSDNGTGFSASAANTSQYSMLQDPDYGASGVEEAPSASPAAELSEPCYYFEATSALSVPAAVPSRKNSDEECRLPPTRFSPPSQQMLAFSAPHMTVMPPLQLQQQQQQQQHRLFSVPLPGQQGFPMMPNQQRHGPLPHPVPLQPIGMQGPYVPQPQQQYAQAAAQRHSGQSSPVSVFNQQAEQARQRSRMPGMNTMYMRPVPVGMANFMPGPMQGPYPMQQPGNYQNTGRQQ